MQRPSALVICGHYGPGTGASWGATNVVPHYDEWELANELTVALSAALQSRDWRAYPITHVSRRRGKLAQAAQLRYKASAESLLVPSCVVSCHFNSSTSSRASGHMVLFHGTSQRGFNLANSIVRELDSTFPNQSSLGTRAREDLYILKHTKAPAVLLEPAFLSSSQDRLIIDKKGYFPVCAEAVATGVVKWYDADSRGGMNA